MRKTSIYLEPSVDAALARAARERGITKAELIRRVLGVEAAAHRRPRLEAIGVGEGPGGVASDVDRHLAETGFASS